MNTDDLEAKTIQNYTVNARAWVRQHQEGGFWEDTAQRFSKLLPTGSVLEVGCGGGRDAAVLLRLGYEYLGTDASEGILAVAKERVPTATFRQCSVYDVAQLGAGFDGFWACAVLLHIPKARIQEALGALNAALRPGAVGVISIKDGDREEFEVRDKDGFHEERLFVYWQKDAFLQELAQAGFSPLDYIFRPVNQRTNWHVFFVQKTGG